MQVEESVNELEKDLTRAYKDSCPLSKIENSKSNPWWNRDTKMLRRSLRKPEHKFNEWYFYSNLELYWIINSTGTVT